MKRVRTSLRQGFSRCALVVLGVGVTMSAAPHAQAPDASIPGPALGLAFGSVIVPVGDLDGDGVEEFAVGDSDSRVNGTDSGRVVVYSGADLQVRFSVAGFGPLDDFGRSIAPAGDVDGDDVGDLLIGAPQDNLDHHLGEGNTENGAGYAAVVSGQDGHVLRVLQRPARYDTVGGDFGTSVALVPDLDGDGVPEHAVGEPTTENEQPEGIFGGAGRVHLFSGASGASLGDIEAGSLGPFEGEHGFGSALRDVGDLDGDGIGDVVVIDNSGRVFALSGTDLGLLYLGDSDGAGIRPSIGRLGDLDADGVDDYSISGGGVSLHSGASGDVLLELTDASPTMPNDLFLGQSATGVGDVDGDGVPDVLVGMPGNQAGGAAAGLLRLHSGADGLLLQIVAGQAGDRLGEALLALARPQGLLLLAGARGVDGPGGVDAGEIRGWSGLGLRRPAVAAVGLAASDFFGQVVAIAGDVDRDGRDDVITGAPRDDLSSSNAGRVRVYSGADGSLLHDVAGSATQVQAGFSVAPAGDIDRDGRADFAYGAPFGPGLVGHAYIRSGRTGGLLRTFTGSSANDWFGHALALVGDVDDDGVEDLAIGAPQDDVAGLGFGMVRVYSGRTGALLRSIAGSAPNTEFAGVLAAVGDCDADGVPDLGIGARLAPGAGGPSSGSVRVHSGADGHELFRVDGSAPGSNMGVAIAAAGDLDADGHDDVLVGEPLSTTGGRALVVSGAGGAVLISFPSVAAGAQTGRSVAGIGDLDGDGRPEVAVGSPLAVGCAAGAGRVSLHSGADGSVLRTQLGLLPNEQFGWALAGPGDLDGDQQPDLVVGSADGGPLASPSGEVWGLMLTLLPGAWQDEGGGVPGASAKPQLVGAGTLEPGTLVALQLSGAQPLAPTYVVGGFSELSTAFFGGVLVPAPDVIVAANTSASGALTLAVLWPPGMPSGTPVWFQHWLPDATALAGYAASNGLRGTAP